MSRFTYLGIALLLFGTMAFAVNRTPLTDSQMATVTAGADYNASGAVVANDSSATISNTYGVALSDSAENSAEAVNIFNSSSSKIGAGLNVLSLDNTPSADRSDVDQKNVVVQQATVNSGASLSGYSRGSDLSIGSATFSTTTSDTNTFSKSDTFTKSSAFTVNAADTRTSDFTGNNAFTASSSSSANLGADAAFSLNPGATTTNTYYPSGNPQTAGTTTNNGASFALAASRSRSASVSDTSSVTASKSNANTFALTDNKYLNNAFTESASHSTTSAANLSLSNVNYLGPVTIGPASAENIVVDGSSLSDTETYAIDLSGSAQQDSTGVNIVNAVASLVGIGNNVLAAGTTSSLDHLNLNQSNIIIQK